MIVLKFLLIFVAINPLNAACPIQTLPGIDAQSCLSVLGLINTTIHSTDDICSIYQESMRCVKRAVHSHGLACNIDDIVTSTAVLIPDVGFNFTICKVTEETESLCSSATRLSKYTMLTCAGYLSLMQSYGGGSMSCTFAPNLLGCAQTTLKYLETQCSQKSLSSAFETSASSAVLSTHYPGLDISQCFQTDTVKDSTCSNYMEIFSNNDVQDCMGKIAYLNFTNVVDPVFISVQCSLLQEVERCAVLRLKKSGSICTMSEMKSAIATYIKLTPPGGIIDTIGQIDVCPANDSYLNSSMCESKSRIVDFFATAGKSMFESFATLGPNMKTIVCSTLSSYSISIARPIDPTCTFKTISDALSSPYGNSILTGLYPGLDVNNCSMILSNVKNRDLTVKIY